MDAAIERYKQQQRNHRRRQVAVGRKRYVAIDLEKNLRLAAERLAERKLQEQKAQAETARRPPASVPTDTSTALKTAEKSALTPTG